MAIATFVVLVMVLGLAQLIGGGADDEDDVKRPVTLPALAPGGTITEDTPCPAPDGSAPRVTTFAKAPPMCIDPAKRYRASIRTNKGTIEATLDAARSPQAVNNFVVLARYHFFDGISFHRIVPGFVIQGGDPQQTGNGGPGYQFADELNPPPRYQVGSLAMANAGPNTNGSQFFIVTNERGAERLNQAPTYSLFGQVEPASLDLLRTIGQAGLPEAQGDPNGGKPTEVVTMQSVTITET